MAQWWCLFTFCLCFVVINCAVNIENAANSVDEHRKEIAAVLNHLNSSPVKVFHYKQGVLLNAHKKADVIELNLDVSVDCLDNYPDLPCTEQTLTCNAFVQNEQILGEVKCNKKDSPEELDTVGPTSAPNFQPEVKQSVSLSNEAVSSEVGDHFVAVRRDSIPCLGCPFDLNANAQGADELINLALRHIESERNNKHILVKVLKLQQQVVSGVKYILIAEIAPTVCDKNTKSNTESCPLDASTASSICQVTYLEKPWINKIKHIINNNCTSSQEFVLEDQINNEIDINGGGKTSPNFDRMAETGRFEELTPSGLGDLESQIVVEEKGVPVDFGVIEEFIVPSTVEGQVYQAPSQPSFLGSDVTDVYTTDFFSTDLYNTEGARPSIYAPLFTTWFTDPYPTSEVVASEATRMKRDTSEEKSGESKSSASSEEVHERRPRRSNNKSDSSSKSSESHEKTKTSDNKSSSSSQESHEKRPKRSNNKSDSNSKSIESHEKKKTSDNKSLSSASSEESHEKRPKRSNKSSESSSSSKSSESHKKNISTTPKSSDNKSSASSSSEESHERRPRRSNKSSDSSSSSSESHKKHKSTTPKSDKKSSESHERRSRRSNKSSDSSSSSSSSESHKKIKATTPKTSHKSSSSSSSSSSSEEHSKRHKRETIHDSDESGEESSSEEELHRPKRAIRQLEKITPEEKPLVKNLADFAASALDDIDDDNHRRVVLQILGAKKMPGDDGVYYHLILRMGISRCLEDRNIDATANCREKLLENYTKICKVQVHISDEHGPKVIKSQCQNIKRDKSESNRTNYSRYRRATRAGGESEISKDDDRVAPLVDKALAHLDTKSSHTNKYKSLEVLSATSQVVAGSLLRIKARISLSDCKKNDAKPAKNCGQLQSATPKICDIKVWEQLWLHRREVTIKCDDDSEEHKFEEKDSRKRRAAGSRAKRALGGRSEVPTEEHAEIGVYLNDGLNYLDTQTRDENKLKIEEVVSASRQVVAGYLWRVVAKVVLSDCKKSDVALRAQCAALHGTEPRLCHFKIWNTPRLQDSHQVNITCDDDLKEYSYRPKRTLLTRPVTREQFSEFLLKYDKKYASHESFEYRLKVFRDNMQVISVLNTYEQGTATYGVTQFADLTQSEFSKMHGLRPDLFNENAVPNPEAEIPNIELPQEFDWRSKKVVSQVKDQGQCGSCWAFSVTGNVEGQYAIKNQELVEFSEQELVDCDREDQGCNGGLMDTAYRVIEQIGGLETEQDYPYDAEDEKCHFNKTLSRVQLSGAVNISSNETDMAKWLVQNGPISIAINANAMQFYVGGVSHPFKFLCSAKNLDHGVLIVGYGVHTYPMFKKSLPYWIVKNSWGPSWGEQGYYRVYRGDGTCGVNQTPSSAVVV